MLQIKMLLRNYKIIGEKPWWYKYTKEAMVGKEVQESGAFLSHLYNYYTIEQWVTKFLPTIEENEKEIQKKYKELKKQKTSQSSQDC
jgi:hypothetical protein